MPRLAANLFRDARPPKASDCSRAIRCPEWLERLEILEMERASGPTPHEGLADGWAHP